MQALELMLMDDFTKTTTSADQTMLIELPVRISLRVIGATYCIIYVSFTPRRVEISIFIFLDGSYHPFIELNTADMITLPPALDSTSNITSIPGGFAFGSKNMESFSVRVSVKS